MRFHDHRRPVNASIQSSQDCAALADSQASLFAAKVDVENRRRTARLLPGPRLSAIDRSENRSLRSGNPAAFVVGKINMNQLQPARRALALPRLATIVCIDQNAIDHPFALADGANHPTLLLAGKTNAVEFDIRAVKLARQKATRFAPACAIITRRENGVARNQETSVLVAEIDVIDRRCCLHHLLVPGLPAIFRVAQKTIVAANPASLAVEKIDSIQILTRRRYARSYPSLLAHDRHRDHEQEECCRDQLIR